MERKRREIVKGEDENLEWKGESYENEQSPLLFCFWFCFCFLFLFFTLSIFETSDIFFGCTKMEICYEGKFSNLAHLSLHTWLRPCLIFTFFQNQ